jgi:hypothetical protein
VSDPTISAIDRVFDLVDNSVEKIDRVLNRTKYTEEQHAFRRAKLPVVIDTAATVKVKKKKEASAPAATTTALATRKFRIIESIDAASGKALFVVTNGAAARAECTTRELAEKILHALETSP